MSMGVQVCCSNGWIGESYAQNVAGEYSTLEKLEQEHGCRLFSMISWDAMDGESEEFAPSEVLAELRKTKDLIAKLKLDDSYLTYGKDALLAEFAELEVDLSKAIEQDSAVSLDVS